MIFIELFKLTLHCSFKNTNQMKKVQIILFFLFIGISSMAQTSSSETNTFAIPYETIEIKPEFEGGYIGFVKFIGANFRLPEVESMSGAVKVTFVIDTSGKIGNIKIISDLGEGTGEEAVRVLKTCPLWTPGLQDGIKVNVAMKMPINIKI
jgi:Gram-negative bacterial TonB protein C-terminal